MKVTHGDIITIDIKATSDGDNVLSRTMSTYQYGFSLRGEPKPTEEYIVSSQDFEDVYGDQCVCFLLVDRNAPETPIGFALVYIEDKPHIVITQTGFEPRPVELTHIGHTSNVPRAHVIGSQVMAFRV
jgi:hypothetical protein